MCKQSVEVGVSAGVEGVEEDQKDLGVGYVDERIVYQSGQAEEGYGCPAGKISEDEKCHPLGDGHVGAVEGSSCVTSAADAAVHLTVAEADDPEGNPVESEKRGQVGHVDGSGLL